MSSDTSNSNNSSSYKKTASNKNKGTTFSTDYMPYLLHASDKMKPENERVGYMKDATDNRSDSSDDINNYISDKKEKNYSDSHTTNDHQNHQNHQSNGSNPSTNIFQRSIQGDGYKFDSKDKNQDDDKGKDLPEDYDNYNELSEEGKMLKRLDMLRKLGELAQYKVKLSQNYNMNSDYFTMKYEYQLHTNIRAKQNFVNWTSSLMLNCIYGLEILNEKYNPWELKLTGWSEQINADITSYYDVFGEIYEKYNKPGKSMSPELKLVLMLGGSALKFHLNNVALSNKLGLPNPSFNGVINGPSNGPTNGPMGSPAPSNQDSRMIEQMRQQAAMDRIREEHKKQSEALQKKSEVEHDLAAKQMQDMMLLQQKQNEFMQQEAIRKQKIQEFERIKNAMEQQTQPRPFGSLNEYATPDLNNVQNPPASIYAQQRRQEIDQQLQAMRSNVSNVKLKSQDMRELAADKLYPQPSPNIKKRSEGINIDTSTESSAESKKSSSTSSSSSSSSTSSSSSEVKAKSRSSGGTTSRKNQIEKSLSSRNNQSTFSKRKYKRSGITIDT